MTEKNDILAIGQPAPTFSAKAYLKGSIDEDINLSDLRGKWVLLFFYPLDFTFVCPTELIELGKMQKEFEKANCQIIGASTDSLYSHKAWADTDDRIGALNYPIISDFTKKIALNYKILHDDGMAFRGSFLIDPDGILRSMAINDLPVGRNPREILRTLKAFQTGDLCPVSWEMGRKTLGKA